MPQYVLTNEEYTFITKLETDLLERAKTATPRAATHLRAAAKLHSDFLAQEEGKRAAVNKKVAAQKERDALKLQRQQERLAALQKKMQPAAQASTPEATTGNTSRRERNQTTA